MTRLATALVCAFLLWSGGAHACERPQALVIGPINIVDVDRGQIRAHRALVLQNGRIARELPASRIGRLPHSIARFDGQNAYVIPGLTDMHVHTLWDREVPRAFFADFLRNGVTSVRDMGGDLELALEMRRQLQSCEVEGPHLWIAGPFLDGAEPVDPSLSIALSTPEDGRRAVRMLHERGVDFLKVYSMLSPDVLAAIEEEAEGFDLQVVGHVPARTGVQGPALRMAGIEHLAIEVGGLCDDGDVHACNAVFAEIVSRRIAQTPTLIARETSTALARPDFVEPPGIERFPVAVRQYWQAERRAALVRATPEWLAARDASLRHARWMTRMLSRRHAILLAGSDAGTPYIEPGVSLHDELALLVEAGLTPREALASATIAPARFLRERQRGLIGAGMVADLVLLRENPLADISNTRTVVAVFHDGRLVTD